METTPMRRLPFRLPEWSPRITWASAHAREVWEPRIRRVSQAWTETEINLVIAGAKPSALQHASPDELPALMKKLAPEGVIALPLVRVPAASGYQSASRTLNHGEPWQYRVAITRPHLAADWAMAWGKSDNETIGRLLGYPECCRKFFQRVWVTERWMDTTWPMYGDRVCSSGVNMLWRWHGVRTVSHLPCHPDCPSSVVQSNAAIDYMAVTHPEEAAWMREILSWPVEWSALHGIAEIRTPIHRTSVPTDATAGKLVVKFDGIGYPEEGANGKVFPHHAHRPAAPLKFAARFNPYHNGFASIEAMRAAHQPLIAAAGGPYDTVLDLGCGDGALLSRIPARRRIGVEQDPERAKHAAKHLDRVFNGDCQDEKVLDEILSIYKPDLVIAQAHRNPVSMFPGQLVLSYSYEAGKQFATLVRG